MTAVIAFKPRGTYLQACRRQGVFQRNEEILAEIAALSSKNDLAAEVLDLPNPTTTAARLADHNRRLLAICEAYQAAGFGDNHFELLKALLFQAGGVSSPQLAAKIFDMHSSATRKSNEFSGPSTFRANGSQI